MLLLPPSKSEISHPEKWMHSPFTSFFILSISLSRFSVHPPDDDDDNDDDDVMISRFSVQPPGGGQIREQHLRGVRGRVQLLLHLPHRVGLQRLRLRPVSLPLKQRTPPPEVQ